MKPPPDQPSRSRGWFLVAWISLVVMCSAIYLLTAPGRIGYPDDEIVFQTTQSLVEDGDLSIAGIAKRTGERDDRPNGTFGWAPGRDQQRYGFFGHGLSLVAIPSYWVADATKARVPKLWRYSLRSDLFTFHQRDLESDWLRLVVSLTNSLLTPLGALLLGLWLRVLGHSERASLLTALCYALGTTAWPYAGTFLSEPLSVIVLLGSALEISRWRRDPGQRRHLWIAAALAGFSIHVHLLDLLAVPCLVAYAAAPRPASESAPALALVPDPDEQRRTWVIALVIGAAGIAALGLSQWWRFGSPFETGRYDHYGSWVWPFRGLLTMLVAPGRSVLIYSPPLVLAALCWPELDRRDRNTARFIAAMVAVRLVFVACRSDWHGGWGIGPRYLVPLVPFAMVPLAGLFDRWHALQIWRRASVTTWLVASVVLQAWLAVHSIFQVMWNLSSEFGRDHYMSVADWRLSASPPLAFWSLQHPALEFARAGNWTAARTAAQFDVLSFGAYRLAEASEADGLWRIMVWLAGLAFVAGLILLTCLWATRRRGAMLPPCSPSGSTNGPPSLS